jgi:hypothetical protein
MHTMHSMHLLLGPVVSHLYVVDLSTPLLVAATKRLLLLLEVAKRSSQSCTWVVTNCN